MPESDIDPGSGGKLNGQMGKVAVSSLTSSTILSSFSKVFTLLATKSAFRSFIDRSFEQGMIMLLFIDSLKLTKNISCTTFSSFVILPPFTPINKL